MRLHFLRCLAVWLLVALLAACQGNSSSQSGGSTPEVALQGAIGLLKAGNINALWKHALPPADYAGMRSDWRLRQRDRPLLSATERSKFDATMRRLTAPDAENRLYAEIQPKLANMKQQYEDQIPVLIAIGEAMAKRNLEQDRNLGVDRKTQVDSIIDVLGPWIGQLAWDDPARTRQAIGIATTTARRLGVKSAEQLRGLDFDTAMSKCSIALAGAKRLLAIYGLSVEDTLDSARSTVVSSGEGHAVVKVEYVLLGKSLSTDVKMVQQDGRWYPQDLLENVRRSHRELIRQSQAAALPGPATTVSKD